MREPPAGVSDESLRVVLAEQFDLTIVALSFLPLGHDSSAWVYRAEDVSGVAYFVKLRLRVTNPAALLVPRYLQDHGAVHVVAPLPTVAGSLWAEAGEYALILYPFVEGVTGMERGLTADQWRAYGVALRQVHAAPLSADLAGRLRRERYEPVGAELIRRLDAYLSGGVPADAEGAALAAHWRAQRATILTLLARAEELGRRLAQNPLPVVLCHADIHTNNLLVDPAGRVWIVDWDETMLAPRERDLMFVVGGISARLVRPHEEAWFFEGYGPTTVDPLALAYYRAAWAVSDIADFADQVCFRTDLGLHSRQEALRFCLGLFAPGEIVAIALGSPLPPEGS
jgi:spectinomycin phosphotransferase